MSLNENKKKSSNNSDDSFRSFQKLCFDIANVSAYTEKTACIKKMFKIGSKEGTLHKELII